MTEPNPYRPPDATTPKQELPARAKVLFVIVPLHVSVVVGTVFALVFGFIPIWTAILAFPFLGVMWLSYWMLTK